MLGVRISIHALREEGDGKLYCGECGRLIFLSTPSARRATRGRAGGAPPEAISIHALREEGDLLRYSLNTKRPEISIHALREEGDHHRAGTFLLVFYFYPRPPRGGRPEKKVCA